MAETYSAKQVASRIGTDPKTLRKFLRSEKSPYQAVGQGARYDFPAADLEKIAKAFKIWQSGKRTVEKKPIETPIPKANGNSKPIAGANAHQFTPSTKWNSCLRCGANRDNPIHQPPRPRISKKVEDAQFGGFDEFREPTEAELAELDNLELDMDEGVPYE